MAARIRKIFADNLKRIRSEQRISQESLALKAGVERAYMGLIERQKSSPTIDMVEKLAKALKIKVADLLSESTKPRPKRPPA